MEISEEEAMIVWSVMQAGYYSYNGDEFAPNVLGVFSSSEKAYAGAKKMMIDEIMAVKPGRDDIEQTEEELNSLDYKSVEELWCDYMEVEPLTFIERVLDAPCLAIEAGTLADGGT